MALSEGYVYTTGGTYVVQSPILSVKITSDWTQFTDDTEGKTYKATARIYNGSTLLDSTIDVYITNQGTNPESLKNLDRNVQLTTLLGSNKYVIYSLPKNLSLSGEDAIVVSQSNESFSLGLNTSNDFWDDIRTELVAGTGSPITITSQKITSAVENVEGTYQTVAKNILKYTITLDPSHLVNYYYDGSDFTSFEAFKTDSNLSVEVGDVAVVSGVNKVIATIGWKGFKHGNSYATELAAGTDIGLTTADGKTTIDYTGSITLTGDDYITPSKQTSSSYDLGFKGLKHGSDRFLEVAAVASSGITLTTANKVLSIGFDRTEADLLDIVGGDYITSTYSSTDNEYTIEWKGFDLPDSDTAKGITVATDSKISLTKIGTNAVLDWEGLEVYVDGSTAGTYEKWSSGVKGLKAGDGVSVQVTDGIATLSFAPAEISSVYGASVSAAESYVTVTPTVQTGYKDYAVKWNGFLTNSSSNSSVYMQNLYSGSNLTISNNSTGKTATISWKGFQTNSSTNSSSYVRKLYADSYLSVVNDTTNDKATVSWNPVLGNAITEPVLRTSVMIGLDDGSNGFDQTTQIVTGINASTSSSNFLSLSSTVASQSVEVLTGAASSGSVTGIKLTSDNASVSKANGVASTTDDNAVISLSSTGTAYALTTTGTVTAKKGYVPGGRDQAVTTESALVSTTETYQTTSGYIASSSDEVFNSFTAPSSVSVLTSSSMLEQTTVPSSVTASKTSNGAIASITGATAKVPKLATATLTTTSAITALTDVNIVPHVAASLSDIPDDAIVLDTVTEGNSTVEIKSIQFVSSVSCVDNTIQCGYGYLYFTKETTTATFKGINTSISSPSYVTGFTQNPTTNDYESFNVDSFATTTTDVVTKVTVGSSVAVAKPSWKKTNSVVDGLVSVSAPVSSSNFETVDVLLKPASTTNVVTANTAVSTGKTFVTGYDSSGPTKKYFGTVDETSTYYVPSSSSTITRTAVNKGYKVNTGTFLTGVTGTANLLQTTSDVATEPLEKALDATQNASVLQSGSITKAKALTADGALVKKTIVYDKVPIDSKLSNAAQAPSGTKTSSNVEAGSYVAGLASEMFPAE